MVAARPLPATYHKPLPLPRLLREPCRICSGSGVAGALTATCSACGAHETPERLAAHLDGAYGGWWGYRWYLGGALVWRWRVRLPCGHRLDALTYEQPTCPACRGCGTYQHTALRSLRSLRDVRPAAPVMPPPTPPAPTPEPDPPTLVLPVLPTALPVMTVIRDTLPLAAIPDTPAIPPIGRIWRRDGVLTHARAAYAFWRSMLNNPQQ